MRTNVPHIYSIGDVTAKLQLAHVAEAQGVVAAETIAGVETQELGDYMNMPRATFCTPQVASFGYTEDAARKRAEESGREIKVATFPYSANGKAQGLNEGVGFVKIIADAEYGELIGAHMVGPDVSELLPELTLAQRFDLTAEEIGRNVHTHPTLSEAIKEAAEGITGHMINL
jgi:dihydrolipoamide dehydrogenase